MNEERIHNENLDGEVFEKETMSTSQSEESQVTDERDSVSELEIKNKELQDSYLRLSAEFDNYRKRTLKEKADLLKSGSEKVLVDVITVVDDFERALENISKSEDIEAVKEGVDLIYNKFKNFLTKHGVKEVDTIGQLFDTDKHEALTTIPAQNEEDKDKIIDCVQKGYTLDDKVIRYPKVIVAK